MSSNYSNVVVKSTGNTPKIQLSSSQINNITTDTSVIDTLDNFNISNINNIIYEILNVYNDASLNNVNISGELITQTIHVNDGIFLY